ncbi:extensin family protein [Croceicoccus sp. Ery5]|uniref:extensin-like domain-containing protein n=1 Tax=Croceicoccus sp. Ery5 TaxID=1703340 RepID=UPI001E38E809|nr:extensin family protein [Croceicoccus sp. Ery5]
MTIRKRLPARPFRIDRAVIALLVLLALLAGGHGWLKAHPEHDPRAPVDLNGPEGWATSMQLAGLRGDPVQCRQALDRAGIGFTALDPMGEGACRRDDRMRIASDAERGLILTPTMPEASCSVNAALHWWMQHRVQPAAEDILGSRVASLQHLGTFNCRRINGGSQGRWSEHATGNAIDIAGFTLEDGRRLTLSADWQNAGNPEGAFLRAVRDGACDAFGTVLSPDYNALHADHFHLDQAERGLGSFCR